MNPVGQINLDAVSFQLCFGDELFQYLNFNHLGWEARYKKLLSSSHFMIRYLIIHCTLTKKCKMINYTWWFWIWTFQLIWYDNYIMIFNWYMMIPIHPSLDRSFHSSSPSTFRSPLKFTQPWPWRLDAMPLDTSAYLGWRVGTVGAGAGFAARGIRQLHSLKPNNLRPPRKERSFFLLWQPFFLGGKLLVSWYRSVILLDAGWNFLGTWMESCSGSFNFLCGGGGLIWRSKI